MRKKRNKGLIIYILILSLVFINSFLPIAYGDSEKNPQDETIKEELRDEAKEEVKEEPKKEEPKVEKKPEIKEEPVKEEPPKEKVEEESQQPPKEEPKKEELKKEEPKIEEKPKEQPKEEKPEVKEPVKEEPKKENKSEVKPEPKVEEVESKPEELEKKEEVKEDVNPSFEFSIETDKNKYKPWEDIIYTINIKNNGNVDLESLNIKDNITGLNQNIKLLKAGETQKIKTTYNKFSTLEERFKKNNILISTDFEGKVISENKEVVVELLEPEVVNEGIEGKEYEKFPEGYEKYLLAIFMKANPTTSTNLRRRLVATPNYQDTISVDKTAKQIEGCREYEITLEVDGSPPPEKPIDVILVMDRSGSMYGTSMNEAKKAAKEFSNKVLQNSNNRVALVSYASEFNSLGKESDATINTNFTNNLSRVRSKINSLNANGPTNTQAAFRKAKNLMISSSRPDATKAIVLLTDGVPTISIGNKFGPEYPETLSESIHSQLAISEAQLAKNVARVFTVGLLNKVPDESLNVATQVLNDSQNAGYYETTSAENLTNIYNKISEELNYAASKAQVKDKISDNFEFVEGSLSSEDAEYDDNSHEITWKPGTITEKTTLTYKIKAKETFEGGENIPTNDFAKLNYIDVNDKEKTRDFPVPRVNVAAPLSIDLGEDREMLTEDIDLGENLVISSGNEPFTYEWTSSTDPNWTSTEKNPVVSPEEDTTYTLKVTDKYGCSASDDIKITVTRGSITIYKNVENENTDKLFTINISGPNGKTWSVMIREGESKTIENLIPGKYKLEEIVPANYKAIGRKVKTTRINSNKLDRRVKFRNKKTNNTWFYDDDSKDNLFKVILN